MIAMFLLSYDVEVARTGHVGHIVGDGQLDIFAAQELRRMMRRQAFDGCDVIHVDLTKVGFADMSAVGLLARTWASLPGDLAARPHLVGRSPAFNRMVGFGRLESFFTLAS